MKKLTIIVPIFNQEKYLERIINSLIGIEKYEKDFEVLFVDDASIDNSVSIIEGYCNVYDFFKLIKLIENSGSPAKPRNIGIKEAKGRYITFLDADDWIDPRGLSQLVQFIEEHDSDIGFGQSYRHRDSKIEKIARFSSYTKKSSINPENIERIYRALGPPGKVFKKNLVDKYKIEFKDFKYGEDKLFFIELLSMCTKASMLPVPVYHVNRYSENKSLIKETSMLQKAEYNLKILDEVLKLKLPLMVRDAIIDRFVEIDFINRMLYTGTFLNSGNKEEFHNKFEELEILLKNNYINIMEHIHSFDYKNIYYLYQTNKDKLIEYIEYSLYYRQNHKYVNDGLVYFDFPKKISEAIITPVKFELYGVNIGTHSISGILFDVIQLYKREEVMINKVSLTEVSNELNEYYIPFELKDDKIYIDIREYDVNYDFNIRITFGKYKSFLVNTSFPNTHEGYIVKNQNQKLKYTPHIKKKQASILESRYMKQVPQHVVALKNIYLYKDVDFSERDSDKVQAGTLFPISTIEYSENNTPRLKLTNEDLFITANLSFVKQVNLDKLSKYITNKPEKVKIIKKCNIYSERSFENEPLDTAKPGDEITVLDIIYTIHLTPRLQIGRGKFITANKNFIEVIF